VNLDNAARGLATPYAGRYVPGSHTLPLSRCKGLVRRQCKGPTKHNATILASRNHARCWLTRVSVLPRFLKISKATVISRTRLSFRPKMQQSPRARGGVDCSIIDGQCRSCDGQTILRTTIAYFCASANKHSAHPSILFGLTVCNQENDARPIYLK
jgi:hypothetical protein